MVVQDKHGTSWTSQCQPWLAVASWSKHGLPWSSNKKQESRSLAVVRKNGHHALPVMVQPWFNHALLW